MDYAARYADLAVRVGCNLAEGQKLVVFGEPEHAPLVRAVAEAGWRAGAGDVDCYYVDEHVRRLHAVHAAQEILDRTPPWLATARLGAEGAALVMTFGDADPELTVYVVGEARTGRILAEPPYDPAGNRLRDVR